jgi:hypothetical protein
MQRHSSPREVEAQRQNEEKKCVSYSNPFSFRFIGARQLCEDTPNTLGMGSIANQESPHGRRGLAATRSVRPTCGVGRPSMGPTPLVLSRGGYLVDPQGGSRCPRSLEAVWVHLWAIESIWCTRVSFWFVKILSLGLVTSEIHGTLHGNLSLAGIRKLGLMRWKDEVCFCYISCAKCPHSNIHCHLWNLSI